MTRDIFNQRSLGKPLNSQVKAVRNPLWHCSHLAVDFACTSSCTLSATLTPSQWSRDGLVLAFALFSGPSRAFHRNDSN